MDLQPRLGQPMRPQTMRGQPMRPEPRKLQPKDISLYESLDIAFFEVLFMMQSGNPLFFQFLIIIKAENPQKFPKNYKKNFPK